MKKLLVAALMLFSPLLAAQEVVDVSIWQPMPGMAGKTLEAGKEAAGIINEMGGSAMVAQDLDGSLHFATSHKNWTEWAAMQKAMSENKGWGKFLTRFNEKPPATMAEHYMLNTPSPGKSLPVYQVFVWQAEMGKVAAMMKAGMEAKALHEKAGAAVTIHVDQMRNMHYVMAFENWEAWAKFQDTPNQEFEAFMEKLNKNPAAQLVDVHTASAL